MYVCNGGTGAAGAQGPTGATGQSVTGLSLGIGDSHCPHGGAQLTTVSGDTYACNGAPGATGPQGAEGASVTSVVLPLGDPDCPRGGSKFTSVNGTTFACNGAQGLPGPAGPNAVTASTTFGTSVIPSSAIIGLGLAADLVDGMHAAGGTESATDLKALIARTACEARAGRWTDGTGCSEYVTVGCANCTWAAARAACPAGRHACTHTDLLFAGFRSIEAQGLRAAPPSPYLWGRGFAVSNENQFLYQWGYGGFACSPGSAPMYAAGVVNSGAMGCYVDTYSGAWGPCCRD